MRLEPIYYYLAWAGAKDQVKGLSESDRSTTVFVDPFDTGSGSLKVLRRSAGRLC